MSTIGWIILAVVIVVVLLVALAVLRSVRRKERAAKAEELRSEARTHATELGSTRAEAKEAEVRAEAARLQAERAQHDADAAKTALAQEEATHEDRLREADRLDPSVNHKAADYQPTTTDAVEGEEPRRAYHSTGGAHRAQD
jgi:FtsZ-interacting cell division protein ZipA